MDLDSLSLNIIPRESPFIGSQLFSGGANPAIGHSYIRCQFEIGRIKFQGAIEKLECLIKHTLLITDNTGPNLSERDTFPDCDIWQFVRPNLITFSKYENAAT